MGLRKLLIFPREYQGVFRTSCIILLAALAFGLVFGSVYVGYMDYYALAELENGIDFFLQITDQGGQVTRAKIATNSLNTNGLFVLYSTICGLAVIGLPLVVAMVAFRGALLGFTTGYLVQRLAWKGIIFVSATLIPFAIIIVLASLFSGATVMTFSWVIVKKVFGVKDHNSTPILGYLVMQFAAFITVFLLALLEAGTVPWLFARLLPWALK